MFRASRRPKNMGGGGGGGGKTKNGPEKKGEEWDGNYRGPK